MFKSIFTQSSLGLGVSIRILRKPQTNTVDTVALVRWRLEPLAFKNMSEVASAVITDNFGPLHPECVVDMSLNSTGDRIEVSRPATARLELVVGLVERCIAAGAVIDTLRGVVGVIFSSTSRLSALFTENPELRGTQDCSPLIITALIRVRHVFGSICRAAAGTK